MKTATVIGAGITGPTAALILARNGHDVTVMEQRPANALHSNGIMGITQANWSRLTSAGVDLTAGELGRMYRDYELGKAARSPFRLITWTDLHNAITAAAQDAGAHFEWETPAIDSSHVMGDHVFDAGGVVSAARRRLPNEYLGSVIYRGVSALDYRGAFTTYKLPGKRGFLDVGHTHNGAAWAFGVRRPRPAHFRTTFTTVPPGELVDLPPRFRAIVEATPMMMILPQAAWTVAGACHDAPWRRFTIGDANGPVRPITTAGANLAIMAGLSVTDLLRGSEDQASALLRRRAYGIALGLRLTGPEIGGRLEDPNFAANQTALYGETS